MKELYMALLDVCNVCMDYEKRKLPKCKECRAVVEVNGKKILVNPVTEKIYGVFDEDKEQLERAAESDLSVFSDTALDDYASEELDYED